MEGKKISFGFIKTKKENKPLIAEKKEYIECVEEKSIKVVGGEVKEEKKLLVIPMKANTLITAERLREIADKVENFDEPEIIDNATDKNEVVKNESLDQMAVRELLEDAKTEKVEDAPKLVVPVNAKPVIEGQVESTIDDYESVPIQDFGLAMLRGMGWKPSKDQAKYKQPQLRPKGLGLGADKLVKKNQKKKSSKDNEEDLAIVKNAFVKIMSGKHSGFYGKVVSLDEENGRVMVDITVKKETVSLSEFMMQAVSKTEFDKQSKVINTDSYEEYKRKETIQSKENNSSKDHRKDVVSSNKSSNEIRSRESSKSDRRDDRPRYEKKYSNGMNRSPSRERYRKDSSSSEKEHSRHMKKNKKKYSSSESLTTDSDDKHNNRRHSSSDSSESNYRREKSKKSKSHKEKRDIDKKRKGKKKKRDRDRSPNYKKYRK